MALGPSEASAQRRAVPRPAVRSAVYIPPRPIRPVYYYPPAYGYGLSFGWSGGWYNHPWYPYGFYAQPFPYPYHRPYYGHYVSSARVLVQPSHAEVYVDGYFVGTVDDFDGWAQRLRVAPGERVLEVFLEGHQTFRQHVLFRPGATVRIEGVLQPLAPGDPPEARPAPSGGYARPAPNPGAPVPAPRRSGPPPAREGMQEYGALAVRVQPADAEVIVDGESWESPEAGDLTLQLAEGMHTVEIRREGFRTYRADVHVRRGETATLNVSLNRQ